VLCGTQALPEEDRGSFDALYESDLASLPTAAQQIYRGVARGMLDLEPIVGAIRNRTWAPKEIGTQHNAYVDKLVAHVQQLHTRLRQFSVPDSVQQLILQEVVAFICEQLVDGYSHIKKCSDEGRALMSLDVKTLQAALHKLFPALLLPMGYVDSYIKAFYLPPDHILEWARAHPEYSVRHLTGLVSVTGGGAQMKRRDQERLIQALLELHGSIKPSP